MACEKVRHVTVEFEFRTRSTFVRYSILSISLPLSHFPPTVYIPTPEKLQMTNSYDSGSYVPPAPSVPSCVALSIRRVFLFFFFPSSCFFSNSAARSGHTGWLSPVSHHFQLPPPNMSTRKDRRHSHRAPIHSWALPRPFCHGARYPPRMTGLQHTRLGAGKYSRSLSLSRTALTRPHLATSPCRSTTRWSPCHRRSNARASPGPTSSSNDAMADTILDRTVAPPWPHLRPHHSHVT